MNRTPRSYRDQLTEGYDGEVGSVVGCALDRVQRGLTSYDVQRAVGYYREHRAELQQMPSSDSARPPARARNEAASRPWCRIGAFGMALDQRTEPWDDPGEPTIGDILQLSGQVTALMYLVKRMFELGDDKFRAGVKELISYDLGTNMQFEHISPAEKQAADDVLLQVLTPDHGTPEDVKNEPRFEL
jgi:hypothetical protein